MSHTMTVFSPASAGTVVANMWEVAAKPWVSTMAGPDPVTSAWICTIPSCPSDSTAGAPSPCRSSVAPRSARGEDGEHRRDLFGERRRRQADLRRRRRFVRIVDPGHPDELTGAGAGVQALRVALLAELQRGVEEHLDEAQPGGVVGGTDAGAVGAVRAHRRDQRDEPGVGEQAGHL